MMCFECSRMQVRELCMFVFVAFALKVLTWIVQLGGTVRNAGTRLALKLLRFRDIRI